MAASTGYRLPRSLLVALEQAGVDVARLAARCGLEAAALHERLPPAQAGRFLAAAVAAVPDPGFGLTVGATVRPELFGVVGFTAMSAPTYGDALARIGRYKRLTTGDGFERLPAGDCTTVRLHLSDADAPYARYKVDAQLAFLVAFGRLLTGRALRPEQVRVGFPPPSYRDRYTAFFACPVVFDAPAHEVTLRNADLALPLISASPELEPLLVAHAEASLDEAPSEVAPGAPAPPRRETMERTRSLLRNTLCGEPPDLDTVAQHLLTSPRTLQRRLREEGSSFQQVLAEVRLELARHHLTRTRLDSAEISYLLGFSHPHSFLRAFRRWTGMTPEEYRRHELAAVTGSGNA
jgi:AraC-like DNA-binding protein